VFVRTVGICEALPLNRNEKAVLRPTPVVGSAGSVGNGAGNVLWPKEYVPAMATLGTLRVAPNSW
jgi:hypothetical protein